MTLESVIAPARLCPRPSPPTGCPGIGFPSRGQTTQLPTQILSPAPRELEETTCFKGKQERLWRVTEGADSTQPQQGLSGGGCSRLRPPTSDQESQRVWGVGSGPRLHPTTAGSWCASPLASESTCEMGCESQLAIEEAFCTVLGWRLLQKLLLQCLCRNSCLCHLVVSQLHLQVVL